MFLQAREGYGVRSGAMCGTFWGGAGGGSRGQILCRGVVGGLLGGCWGVVGFVRGGEWEIFVFVASPLPNFNRESSVPPVVASFLRLWGLGTQQKCGFSLGKTQLLKFAY